MSETLDADILEPSIDPKTKKIGIRSVKGRNEAGTRTAIKVRHYDTVYTDEPESLGGTNTAPSPLETVLIALVGCDGVIINGVATAMKFDYAAVEFECQSQIDVRGPKGVPGIRPYFETLDLKLVVFTDEPEDRFLKLQKNVEFRCPVMNLMHAADVKMNVVWEKRPKAEAGEKRV
ncbi:MAG: OsmC family protein [Pseudomonadota bacterium]